MNREDRVETIKDLCAQYNCPEKIAKIHLEQYVSRDWHPHPPEEFLAWWKEQGRETKTVVAWNTKCFRDEYMEMKQYGVIGPS